MIDLDNQTNTPLNIELLNSIASFLSSKNIELLFVDWQQMQEINLKHRKLDKPTDVLSFPINDPNGKFLGSIVICDDIAKSVAVELGHLVETEVAVLFTHGILHLLGLDHEKDSGQMREEEAKIAKQFQLPSVLTSRAE